MKRTTEFRLGITGGIIGLLIGLSSIFLLGPGPIILMIFAIIMCSFVLKIDHQIYACVMIFIGLISFLIPFLKIPGILFIASGAIAFRKPKPLNDK